MHNRKGGKGIKKKPYNKRMNFTEAQSTEMAVKNLIKIRKNTHIITADKILQRYRNPTEEINVHDRKFCGMYNDDKPDEKKDDKFSDRSAKAFNKEFAKVVDAADVIIEVLDARDPMGSRCFPVERSINLKGKTLLLLLNKSDLVPRDNLKQWLQVLKKEYPTVVFKASTQLQAKRLGRLGIKPQILGESFTTSMCLGADTLMQLLRKLRHAMVETNYAQLSKNAESVENGQSAEGSESVNKMAVGVIGLPNVGKSSVINSLKRSRACCVGAVPGVTKHMQEVSIDSKIKLIDCPGLIFASGDDNDAMYALKNAINPDTLDDPISAAEAVIARAGHEEMSIHYKLGVLKNPSHFLYRLANRRGKIQKGGIPDLNAAASLVLNDWNSGRIKYFTEPPFQADEEITPEELDVVNSLPNPRVRDVICLGGPDSNAMEVDVTIDTSGPIPANTLINPDIPEPIQKKIPVKKPRWETKRLHVNMANVDLRKLRKKDLKKLNRERRRNFKKADDLTDAFEAFGGIDSEDIISVSL